MKENTGMQVRRKMAWDYIGWALYAFAGLGMDGVVMVALQKVFGKSAGEWSVLESCIHWSIVCLIWAGVAVILNGTARKKYGESLLEKRGKFTKNGFLLSCLLVIILVTVETMLWDGMKPVREFQNMGVVKFCFQYGYYLLETVLVILILAFGQRCMECLTGKKSIPWGGILLALSWGLVHCLTKGVATGMEAVLTSLCYGVIYVSLNQNIRWSYALIAVAFLL